MQVSVNREALPVCRRDAEAKWGARGDILSFFAAANPTQHRKQRHPGHVSLGHPKQQD